jgi:uncharacterized membrane protein YcaP (DUF421 family)
MCKYAHNKLKNGEFMLVILIRTVIIYFLLMLMMRLLGKRQLGELEATELVTALLLSEIASLPLTNPDMPTAFALIPMSVIVALEIILSFVLVKFPMFRSVLSARPSVVIQKGVLNQSELKRQRISTDELICSLRQAGVAYISEVNYAIVEENGALTVIPKSNSRPLTARDLGLDIRENGLMHIIISDGHIDLHGLRTVNKTIGWLNCYLKNRSLSCSDVFLMLSDDSGHISIIKKENRK